MALKVPRCARCPGACELKTLPSVSAEDGPLKLTMLAPPVFRCPKDHSAPVHGDFMIRLIQQIRSTKDLHARVPEAMVGINDGAGFPHSG